MLFLLHSTAFFDFVFQHPALSLSSEFFFSLPTGPPCCPAHFLRCYSQFLFCGTARAGASASEAAGGGALLHLNVNIGIAYLNCNVSLGLCWAGGWAGLAALQFSAVSFFFRRPQSKRWARLEEVFRGFRG